MFLDRDHTRNKPATVSQTFQKKHLANTSKSCHYCFTFCFWHLWFCGVPIVITDITVAVVVVAADAAAPAAASFLLLFLFLSCFVLFLVYTVYYKIFIDFQQVVSYQKHVSNGHYIIKIIGLVFRSLIQFQGKATFGGARDMTCDMCVFSSDQRPLKISILSRSFDVEPWRDVRVLLPFGISILMLRYSNAEFKDFQKKV